MGGDMELKSCPFCGGRGEAETTADDMERGRA